MPKPSPSIILLVIAFLISSVAAANFYVGKNAEQTKRVLAEQQIGLLKKQVSTLEEEREELSKAKTALEEQTNDLTRQAKEIAEQLAQEKRARVALTTELAQVRNDSSQIKSQLNQEKQEKGVLSEDLSKAKQSYQALSNELTTLRQAKEALEKRVKEMLAARAKEAEQIVVTAPRGTAPVSTPGTSTPAAPAPAPAVSVPAKGGLEGKVLVVNREYNFVVVSLGSKDTVGKGARFAVIRNGKQIMTVEVDKLYDNMSSANMLEEEKKGSEVREGDTVRLIS